MTSYIKIFSIEDLIVKSMPFRLVHAVYVFHTCKSTALCRRPCLSSEKACVLVQQLKVINLARYYFENKIVRKILTHCVFLHCCNHNFIISLFLINMAETKGEGILQFGFCQLNRLPREKYALSFCSRHKSNRLIYKWTLGAKNV